MVAASPNNRPDLQDLLAFYAEAGVDEPLEDAPVDRFRQAAPQQQPAAPPPGSTEHAEREAVRPKVAPNTAGSRPSATQPDRPAATAAVPAVTAADRVMGRADAPVTVIEYASFTCNHCAAWTNDVLPQFKARYIDTSKVRLVFRDMPTPPAQIAAVAAGIGRCAAPGRFFDVAHSLMSGQAAAFEKGDGTDWFAAAIAVSASQTGRSGSC